MLVGLAETQFSIFSNRYCHQLEHRSSARLEKLDFLWIHHYLQCLEGQDPSGIGRGARAEAQALIVNRRQSGRGEIPPRPFPSPSFALFVVQQHNRLSRQPGPLE